MKQLKSIALVFLLVIIAGSSAIAADRKPDSDRRTTSTMNTVQPRVSTQPQPSPISPAIQTKASQTQPSAVQPATTDTTLQPALKAPLTGEQIKWQVISGGGNRSTSMNFILSATVGQTAAGPSSSDNFRVNSGFWQNFSGGGCCAGLTGNVDCDGANGIDISDLSRLIDYLYISFSPLCCVQSANTDGDGSGGVDISDLSRLIDYLYISFALPAVCQ